MTQCDKVQSRLSALLDGELKGADAKVVRSHVASCALCGGEWEKLRRLSGRLREQGRETPPAPPWERLEIRLRTARRSGFAWRIAAAAAVLLVAGAGLLVYLASAPVVIPLPRVADSAGVVEWSPRGSESWIRLKAAQPLDPGDRVRTAEGTARVDFEGATVYLDRKTQFLISPRGAGAPLLLAAGEVYVEDYGRKVRVRTPDGLFEPIGTRFAVRRNPEGTRVVVEEGAVRARSKAAESPPLTIGKGKQAEVDPAAVKVAEATADLGWARKAAERLGGYVSVFNGEDLSGWTPSPRSKPWPVRDGAIHAVPMTHLFLDREFRDGELTLEFRSTIPDPRRMDSIFKFGRRGAMLNLYSDGRAILFGLGEQEPNQRMTIAEGWKVLDGEWHRARMRFLGRRVTVEIDGKHVLTDRLTGDPGKIYLRLKSSKRGKGEYRNLRFRPEIP